MIQVTGLAKRFRLPKRAAAAGLDERASRRLRTM